MADERLRRQILEGVAKGLLPWSLPKRTWGGFGNGDPCCVCGKTITAQQLETEFEDAAHRPYHVHMQCFSAWEDIAGSEAPEPALPLSLNDGYSAAGDRYPPKGSR